MLMRSDKMLVEDKNEWCRVDVVHGDAGIPCNTIQGAIDNYFLDEPNRKGATIVKIGHPNYCVPEVDAEYVIEDIINHQIDDEIAEWSEDYLTDVKKEHVDELSEALTNIFREWEKKHGYENTGYVVLETKTYKVDANGILME